MNTRRPMIAPGWISMPVSHDLPSGPGSRIAVEDDRDVFAESVEHEDIFPYPSELLNYWGTRQPSKTTAATRPATAIP